MTVHVVEAVGDQLYVLLDGSHHVGEHGGTARTRDHEEIREARRAEPEVGNRAGRPLVAQGRPVPTTDVDRVERAGHRVEAGGEHDRVDLDLAAAAHDAAWRDPLDPGHAHVDELDVVAVVGLEVGRVGARPLASDAVVTRREQGRRLRVLHDLADLLAHEGRRDLVRLVALDQVAEDADEEETADLPILFEQRALLVGA